MLKLASKEGDLMLTPFSGSGSECVASKATGRKYIGIEEDKTYCDIALERLSHVTDNEDSLGQLTLNMIMESK